MTQSLVERTVRATLARITRTCLLLNPVDELEHLGDPCTRSRESFKRLTKVYGDRAGEALQAARDHWHATHPCAHCSPRPDCKHSRTSSSTWQLRPSSSATSLQPGCNTPSTDRSRNHGKQGSGRPHTERSDGGQRSNRSAVHRRCALRRRRLQQIGGGYSSRMAIASESQTDGVL
jgi:hypothetical protein